MFMFVCVNLWLIYGYVLSEPSSVCVSVFGEDFFGDEEGVDGGGKPGVEGHLA